MRKMRLVTCLLVALHAGDATAEEDDAILGSVVIAEGEGCPEGMVVSGLGGGQGPVSKVCVRPSSQQMPSDVEEVEADEAPPVDDSEA